MYNVLIALPGWWVCSACWSPVTATWQYVHTWPGRFRWWCFLLEQEGQGVLPSNLPWCKPPLGLGAAEDWG